MLHNPNYDFNDDLIPLGGTAWVRLAEKWLNTPRDDGHRRLLRADLRAGARPVPGRGGRGRARCPRPPPPAGRPRRRGTGRRRGALRRRRRAAAADRHQRLPRPGGLLRVGRAGVAAAHAVVPRRGSRGRRGGAVRARAEPLGLQLVAAHDAGERRPEPQFRRLQPAAGRQRRLRRTGPCHRAGALAADGRERTGHRRLRRPARPDGAADRHQQRPARRARGPVLRRPQPQLEPCHLAPRAAAARVALRPAGLDRPAHRPGPQRPWRAHLQCARRRRHAGPGPRLVGRPGDVDLRRVVDLGQALGHGLRGGLRRMPAGRVHRHRDGVRHAALERRDVRAARRPVAGEPPRDG
jgi:hypothetical protein